MSIIQLSDKDDAELKRLGESLDRKLEADRRFFSRRPERKHRIRRAFHEEVRSQEIPNGWRFPVESGMAHFTVVRQIVPGARLRLFICAPSSCETDLDEQSAAAVFEYLANLPGRPEVIRPIEKLINGGHGDD